MGHGCRICGRTRANEKFSGKGHKNHICKECAAMPKDEITEIEQKDEIYGFMQQSNISSKNIARLNELKNAKNNEVSEWASLVLEVAKIKPHKRRRLKILAAKNKELLLKLTEIGFIDADDCSVMEYLD